MKYLYTLVLAFVLCLNVGFAQMSDGNFGDEWINLDQSYFKMAVAEDGIYRISQATLVQAGIPVSQIATGNYQLFRLGEQVPIYVSASGLLGINDYIEFYGQKNRSELDRHLFANPDDEMLNPDYSLVTDTMSYFLTWVPGNGNGSLRFISTPNDLSNPPPVESFFWYDERQVFSNTHIKKRETTDGTSYSDYNETEGYGTSFELITEHTIQATNPVITGPASTFRTRFATNLPLNSGHTIAITLNNNPPLYEESFSGVKLKKVAVPITNSLLTSDIAVKFTGTGGTNDRHSVAYVSLTYPRNFDFGGATSFAFTVEASTEGKLLDIANFSDAMGNPILYDVTNGLRIEAIVANGRTRIVLPPSTTDRDLILFENNSAFTQVNTIGETNFIDYAQDPATYLIISNSRLYNDPQGTNQVAAYANYRSSVAGGGFTTRVVEVEDLYNQYAYGVHRHPLSIKNFIQRVNRQWEDLAYLLIIGKGREYHTVRTPAQVTGAQSTLFVPTYGYPGSDNLLVSENGKRFPAVATGRIAATSAADIAIYLKKVRDLEAVQQNSGQTIEDRAWMKQILHLGGGGNDGERTVIRRHLENMEEIIENNVFGANVISVFKDSNDPVQISESENIFGTINRGVSIITFFGHSGVGTFDFNIDNPDNYENFGKYPLMFSLGCYSGNIHTSSVGISERFVYYEDKGAIAFGATTGLGYISGLNPFMSRFYELAGGPLYGRGMGDILRATVETYNAAINITLGPLAQQFTFQGDPAIKLNPSSGPDFVVDASSVTLEPSNLTSSLDSFQINFKLVNLGFGVADSIDIVVRQELPSGDILTIITDKIKSPTNSKVYSYNVVSYKKAAVGQNKLYIEVDVNNDAEESPSPTAELNNSLISSNGSLGIPFYVFDESASPVYPTDFAIVGNANFTLKASTSNALSSPRKYIMEMDTTELFNSSTKIRTEILQGGGVLKWTPNVVMQDSTVYYWRVSPDSLSPQAGYIWANSSFVYLPESGNGWNQSHFYQYKKDEFEGMSINTAREFTFGLNGFFIGIKNLLYDPVTPPAYIYNLDNAAASVRPWNFLDAGVAVVVGDGVTGGGWLNPPGGNFGSVNVGSTRVFAFPTNTTGQRDTLMTFLEDIIPDNSFVFLFTVQKPGASFSPEEWAQDSIALGKNIFSVLESEGALRARELAEKGTVPYTFIYRKGINVLGEDIAATIDEEIFTEVFVPISQKSGAMRSTVIGPATQWNQLKWRTSGIDDVIADTSYVRIFGVDQNNNETLLIDRLYSKDTTLNFVDAAIHPYLKLTYAAIDNIERTPNQLDYWRVLYTGLPDAAVNANEHFVFNRDTLQQGEEMQFEVAVENISDYDMDSLLVQMSLTDLANNEVIQTKRYPPLSSNESVNAAFNFDTKVVGGIQQLVFEVNPDNDQPELRQSNNFVVNDFFVSEDKINPLLNVTFDGQHIMQGDIVSPKPQISISLIDENPFLSLSDTSLFNIFIKYPDQTVTLIPFNSEWITFSPDTQGGENMASVELRPIFDQDGIYELLVQAEDATGNQSGSLDYKVNFEIITRSAISNIVNYPNPFTTSTQFAYTLTGEELPEFFKIQIFTVSGKVVKEITQDEIGPLRVGTHLTDYKWDGTDEYGGRLANGTYLYRVVSKKTNGETYDLHKTKVDNFVNRGFGKLVILR